MPTVVVIVLELDDEEDGDTGGESSDCGAHTLSSIDPPEAFAITFVEYMSISASCDEVLESAAAGLLLINIITMLSSVSSSNLVWSLK